MFNNFTTTVVIRALNEGFYIGKLLYGLQQQTKLPDEIILVDSGSTDDTLLIASSYDIKIVKINKDEFTFGRALNIGCSKANNEILIFLSAHVYPSHKDWLLNLIKPFDDKSVVCSYGKQRGNSLTKFSEEQLFLSLFPEDPKNVRSQYFCNNANCAIRKKEWEILKYDELLTGLEDLDWAKKQYQKGNKIFYASDAEIIHVHNEDWKQIKNRYKREAIALSKIEPAITFNFLKLLYLIFLSILSDLLSIRSLKSLRLNFLSIILFRYNQYVGTYEGIKLKNSDIDKLTSTFYYPQGKQIKYLNKLKKSRKTNNISQKSRKLINYDSF